MSAQDYTPEEAMAILNMARSTFFKEVEKGNIPSVLEPGKRRGRRYPKEAIDAYAALITRKKRLPYDLSFTKATNADMWEAVEHARQLYGDDNVIPFRKVLEWRSINDEMSMSVKDQGKFVGYVTIMPIDEDIIKLLIKGETKLRHIPDRALRQWSDPELSAYITDVSIVPAGDKQKDTYRGRFLLEHTAKWAITLYHQYDIRRFYGIGITPTGQELSERFGFSEIISLEDGRLKGYVLENMSKPTKLLAKFLAEKD